MPHACLLAFLPISALGTGRPKRSTQGQGGAAVQLQKVTEKIASVPPAKRMAANIPEPIGENPMAPQLARPKLRPLAKVNFISFLFKCLSRMRGQAPAHPLNASRPPVPSQLTQGLLPATGVPVGYPRHADAMAGSIYGFRPATPLAAPSASQRASISAQLTSMTCSPKSNFPA